MNDLVVFTAEGRSNTKDERVGDAVEAASNSRIPSSYRSNDTKEELCREYIMSFLAQFKNVYPKRKEPLLMIPNEFGVSKFVCTRGRNLHICTEESTLAHILHAAHRS